MKMKKNKYLFFNIIIALVILALIFQIMEMLWNYPIDYIKMNAFSQIKRIDGLIDIQDNFSIDAYTATLGSWVLCGTYCNQDFEKNVDENEKWVHISTDYTGPYEITRKHIGNYSYFRIGYLIPNISYDYAYIDVDRDSDYGIFAFFSLQEKIFVIYSINYL